jgi:hypothetical protein
MSEQISSNDDMSLEEGLGWAEFCAWSALVMTPIIWWLQGPSVSTDQYVVRTSLVVISAVAAIGLRIRKLVVKRTITSHAEKFIDASSNSSSSTKAP